jgi:hypothetical protein
MVSMEFRVSGSAFWAKRKVAPQRVADPRRGGRKERIIGRKEISSARTSFPPCPPLVFAFSASRVCDPLRFKYVTGIIGRFANRPYVLCPPR